MKEKTKSGFATASLVLGIIGICTSFIPIINNLSFILALMAIIFGVVSLIKKASKGMAIVGVIISVLTIVFVINTQKALSDALDTFSADLNNISSDFTSSLNNASGSNTEEILANNVDVSFGDFEVKKSKYGITDTVLKVKVKNKSSEAKSFSIQIEAINQDGSRITNDYISASNLNAGQSQEFEIFKYVQSDKLEVMKKAKFKIVEVSMY